MARLLKLSVALTLSLWVTGVLSLFAQTTTGRIVGTVTDETGAVMPGVDVVVRNPSTGLSRNVVTNESGTYQVPLLPPAVYEVEASLPGFRTELRSGLTIQVEAVARVDFALRVGNVSDKIEVTADAPLLQSENASLGQVMDSRKVTDIPLNARHFMRLTVLSPGVLPDVEGGDRQSPSFYSNGARRNENNFLLDGVDNNDYGNAQLVIIPSVDAIQEFKVSTSAYGAEFGRAAGGVLNIQTKSGSNEFQAVFFEFVRNDIFDARNFFATRKQPYRRNQFGTVISGPIKRDRTFFMFNYEGARIRRVDTKLATVPTLRQRAGDFSELTRQLVDPITRQPFAGNLIPASRINPVGRGLGTFYPEPNRSGANNYLGNARALNNFDLITARVDHRVSDRQNVFGRFTWQDTYEIQTNFDSTAAFPNQGSVFFQPIGRNAALSDTYVIGPREVNEFRVGFNRIIGGIYEELYKQDFAKQLGITGVQSQLYPHPKGYNFGFPRATLTGYDPIGGIAFNAQLRIDNTWHWADTLAVTRGNHQMKMGGEFRTMMLNVYQEGPPNGQFSFDGRYSGNAYADLLLGYPSRTQRTIGDTHSQHRSRGTGLFFQDDWKITPQFTVNLGVRWEMQTAPINVLKGVAGGISTFDPISRQWVIGGRKGPQTFRDPIDPRRTITIAGGADFGIPAGLFKSDFNNYAPRIGFAWSPKSHSMVLRGGYGAFYAPDAGTITHSFRAQGYPWTIPQTFIANTAVPNITMSDPFPEALTQSSITGKAIDLHMRTGYMQNWNLGVQRPIGKNMVVDLTYVGSKGTKMRGTRDINQPFLGSGSIDSRRPIPGWGSISQTERSQASSYHSLQGRFERRFSAGLTFVSAYTWSHSIDDDSSQNAYDRRADRGNSAFDIRHRLVNSYSYELPVGSGRRFLKNLSGIGNVLLGGWQVAGITTVSTGQSFEPMVSGDISQTGGSSVRPNRVGNGILPRGERNANRWFDTSAFVVPATGTYGNAGRGMLKAPGIHNWDLTLTKNTRFGERHNLQYRVEMFNALNHALFSLPNATVNSQAFGTITRAKDARQIQFGLKFYY